MLPTTLGWIPISAARLSVPIHKLSGRHNKDHRLFQNMRSGCLGLNDESVIALNGPNSNQLKVRMHAMLLVAGIMYMTVENYGKCKKSVRVSNIENLFRQIV